MATYKRQWKNEWILLRSYPQFYIGMKGCCDSNTQPQPPTNILISHYLSLLIGFECLYDQTKLDLIVAVDCSTTDITYLKSLKSEMNKIIEICSKIDFRFALVDYWDQHSMTNYFARVQNFTRDVKKMKSYVKNLSQRSIGFMKGMAYGLAQVLSEDKGARSEAAKLCIVLRKYLNLCGL